VTTPLSPPQKNTQYIEDTGGQPSVYFWDWLNRLYRLAITPQSTGVTTGSFTGTLSGFSGAAPTGPINYTIIGNNTTGGVCFLTTASIGITGTSNSTSMSMSGLPAACTPATGSPDVMCIALNNSNIVLAEVFIITGGLFFNPCKTTTGANPQFTSFVSSGWTASGTKGINQGWTISYTLD
jgi:hypothetical protein